VAAHRDRDGAVAVLEDVAADALPFAAEDDGDLAAEIDRRWRIAARRRAVAPVAFLLQRLERAREVRHLRDRHPLAGAGRSFDRRGREAGAVVLRDDDEVDAEAVGDAENGAEVLRVGDAVEDEDERRRLPIDDVVEVGVRPLGDVGDDTVVHAASGQAVDLLRRHLPHRHARALRLGDGALQLRAVLARHADVVHAVRMRAQRLEHGIESVDDHRSRARRLGSPGPS